MPAHVFVTNVKPPLKLTFNAYACILWKIHTLIYAPRPCAEFRKAVKDDEVFFICFLDLRSVFFLSILSPSDCALF